MVTNKRSKAISTIYQLLRRTFQFIEEGVYWAPWFFWGSYL